MTPQQKRRARAERDYQKARGLYLEEHFWCEVCKGDIATEIHHKRGRVGSLLADPQHFLAVCEPCHRIIEDNPAWAIENGFKESRL